MPFLFVGQSAASEDAKSALIAIEKAVAEAVVNLDFETMDQTYADDFVFYHSTGGISLNNLVAMLQVQPYAAVMDGGQFLGLITRSDVLNHLRKQV